MIWVSVRVSIPVVQGVTGGISIQKIKEISSWRWVKIETGICLQQNSKQYGSSYQRTEDMGSLAIQFSKPISCVEMEL